MKKKKGSQVIKKEYITDEFIDDLRNKQFELRCEKAMKSIQSFNRQEFLKHIKVDYKTFISSQKKHFSRFFDIATGVYLDPPSIPNPTIQKIDINSIETDDKIHLYSLDHFVSKLMENDGAKFLLNIENPDFLNTLSFSLFPAISTYFHINFLPDSKKTTKSSDLINYQIHNFNNVFVWLSNKIKEEPENINAYQTAFDCLMRPMFFSPLFITFCSNFFQPIFSYFQNLKINESEMSTSNFLISQFKVQFETSAHLIPPFIALNLRHSDDPIRTLSKSFFEIALKTAESAQYCGLFHFSRPPTKKILESFQQVFVNDQSSNNCVLNSLIDEIKLIGDTIEKQMNSVKDNPEFNALTCSFLEKEVKVLINGHLESVEDETARLSVALQMKNYYFEKELFLEQNKLLFRKVLLSSSDLELLNYIYNEESDEEFNLTNTEKSYKWINFGFSEKANDDDEEEEKNEETNSSISQTMMNNAGTIAPNLRHILQNSDPIPQFIKAPKKMKVETFFDEYLVKKGKIGTYPKRKQDRDIIFKICKYLNKDPITEITKELNNTTLDQTHEIELLTIATNVKKKIDNIKDLLFYIGNDIELIDNLVFLNKKETETKYLQNLKKNTNKYYINNPGQLYKDLLYNMENLDKIVTRKPELILMKMIDQEEESKSGIFSFLYSKSYIYRSLFLDFLSSNDFTHSIDNSFSVLLNSFGKKILDYQFKSSFPVENVSQSKLNKHSFLINKILDIRKCRYEIILKCKEAFTDPSVFRKVDLFNEVVGGVKIWVSEDLPNNIDDLGADEMPGLIASTIFIANPSHIASTTMMLQHLFFRCDSSCFKDKETNMITFASIALQSLQRIIENDEDLSKNYQGSLKDLSKFNNDIISFVETNLI